MESRRRGRRGRNHHPCKPSPSIPIVAHSFSNSQSSSWPCISGFHGFFIMSTLMAIIYLMLEYHCVTCSTKCNMSNITQNIDDIAQNLSHIKQSYHELEQQITKFSLQMPKLEGQIEILEVLANTIQSKDAEWNPKTDLALPNVDVYLTKPENGKNVSRLTRKRFSDNMITV